MINTLASSMKEKIKKALKQEYSTLGLDDKAFDGVASLLSKTITDEAQIEDSVKGAEETLKAIQSVVDRERNAKAEAERKLRELAKQEPPKQPEQKEPKTEEPKSEMGELLDLIKSLKGEVEQMKQKATTETRTKTLTALLDEKSVPSAFYNLAIEGREFANDEDLNTYAESIEARYKELVEFQANDRFKESKAPEAGGGKPEGDIDPLAKMISTGTKELTESKKD